MTPAPGQPRLLDRVREACRVRHYSLRTEAAYIQWSKRYILFHHKRHPLEMGAAEINAFLTHLAVEGHVSASTQNQAFSALLFLYQKVLEVEPGQIAGVVRAATDAAAGGPDARGSRPHHRAARGRLRPDRPAPVQGRAPPPGVPVPAGQGSRWRQQRDRGARR